MDKENVKCPSCGKIAAAGTRFCTECGAKIENALLSEDKKEEKKPAYNVMPAFSPRENGGGSNPNQNGTPPPAANYDYGRERAYRDEPPERTSAYATIGAWEFVGYMILFSLPIIGLIMAIIWAGDSSKINRRNYARAVLIMIAIGVAICILMFIAFAALFNNIINYFEKYQTSNGGYSYNYDYGEGGGDGGNPAWNFGAAINEGV